MNTIHPTTVDTDINFENKPLKRMFRPDLDHSPSREEFGEASSQINSCGTPHSRGSTPSHGSM